MKSSTRIAVFELSPIRLVNAVYDSEPNKPAAPVPLDQALTVCFE